MPSQQQLAEMTKFNEELVNAGVLLAGEGLKPSAEGARVRLSGTERTVIDGPFTESKELVAGFWLWQVSSLEEAIEWARRIRSLVGSVGAGTPPARTGRTPSAWRASSPTPSTRGGATSAAG